MSQIDFRNYFLTSARGFSFVDTATVTWSFNKTTNTLTADVSVAAGSIADDAVTNAKLANMVQSTIKGRAAGAGTGDPQDLSSTQTIAILLGESPTWTGTHTFSILPVLPNQSANSVYAGPTSGAATTPAFRSLVDADIPTTLSLTTASSLTSVGTITSGVWSATAIVETKGGTNQTSYVLGDILYSSAANTLSKLSGNTTTTKKFLRQTGTGSGSAAPAWDTLVSGDIPALGANPSQSVGLTAVNGSASTYLRSDGAPALDVTIIPTWSGTHTFNNTPVVPNDSWTYAKIQNVSATSRVLGRITTGPGDIEELTAANVKTILALAAADLSDYLTGTWTATVRGAGTAGTYEISSQNSTYTRVGNRIIIDGDITLAGSITGGGTGDLAITGIPVSKVANHMPMGACSFSKVTFTGQVAVGFQSSGSSSTLVFYTTASGSTISTVAVSGLTAGARIIFSISYQV